MYLFDPITCQKTPTNYDMLEGITGITRGNLACYKTRKQMIKSLGCYLVEDDAVYSQLYSFMKKQKLEMEVWKDIENSTWQISNYGRARYITSKGYKLAIPQLIRKRLVYQIRGDKGRITYGVARLVAEYFMDTPNAANLLLLHKDDNRWNCRVENLEWVSKSYMGKRYGGLANGIPVIKVDINTGEQLEDYVSMEDAAKDNFTCRENIWAALDNPNKSAAGFRWIKVNG